MRRIVTLFSGVLTLALLAASAPAATPVAAQTTAPPRAVFQTTVPGIKLNKFPDVATFGRTVHISSNTDRLNAVYVSKADNANTFTSPLALGLAEDQGDYSPTSIATGRDGTVYFAYLNFKTGRLNLRVKPANSNTWGPERLVYARSGSEFLSNLNIGVASDNAIFIAWRVSDQKMRVRRSTDAGASWGSVFQLGERFGVGMPYIATGPSGQVAVLFGAETSAVQLGVFAAVWTGSGFTFEAVSPSTGGYANPTGTYDPNGTLYIAYRGVSETGTPSGVFFGQRTAANAWQVSRLIGPAQVFDQVNIDADEQGNLHLTWIAALSGANRLYYSFRPAGSTFGNPIVAPNSGGDGLFNPSMESNVGDEAYAHVVTEYFTGGTTNVRYFLFAATSAGSGPRAAPVIEDGEAVSEKEPSLTVRFDNVQGSPTQIRWNWDSAPTDADNDSNGWQTFANPMTIPLPDSILANAPCSPETLYTQVRAGATGTPGAAQNDAITIDTGINAALTVGNPYAPKASEFTPVQAELGDIGSGGASDGDTGYTRDPIYYIQLIGASDCSGMKNLSVGRSGTTMQKAMTVSKENFANVLPYPGVMAEGPNQLLVRVTDQAGNISDYPQTIILDQTRPTLNGGAVAAVSDPKATVLLTLTFSNVNVTDNAYPGGYWGVWVANSRTPVSDPAGSTSLSWYPVRAKPSGNGFVINNWSLATGLSGTLDPGTYNVYVRFLDGAGNATTASLTTSVTLSQVTFPKTYLPATRR